MKDLRLLLTVCLFIFFLASCKTNGDLIVGSWKFSGIRQASMPHSAYKDNSQDNQKPVEMVEDNDANGRPKGSDPKSMSARFESLQSVNPEIISAFTLNSDKTAKLTYPGKTLTGKWKVNKNLTTITFTDPGTKKSVIINFSRINPTYLRVSPLAPADSVELFYQKY